MTLNKKNKAISPVVAVTLLLGIIIISTISFSTWFKTMQTDFQTEVESQENPTAKGEINSVIGENLYFTNKDKSNKTITNLTIDNIDCTPDEKTIKTGSDKININSCINQLNVGQHKIILKTEKKIYHKTIFIKGRKIKKSCKEYLDAGNTTSGIYTINPTGLTPIEVYCDQITDGGGWTIFKQNFNYDYSSDITCRKIKIVDKSTVNTIRNMDYTDYKVNTDLTFKINTDDSTSNSYIRTMLLNNKRNYDIFMGYGLDHTNIKGFYQNSLTLLCSSGGGTNSCGIGNKPILNGYTNDLIVYEFELNPTCAGSTAHNNLWTRNTYSIKGTYYDIWIR